MKIYVCYGLEMILMDKISSEDVYVEEVVKPNIP